MGENERYIPYFLRAPKPPADLKETFSVMFMAFGITMAAVMFSNALKLLTQNAYIGSLHVGLFLFPNPVMGQGFELPYLLAKFFNAIIAVHMIASNAITDMFAKWQLLELDAYKVFFFFIINPFLEEVEWRGVFWLTRNYSQKNWWKVSFLISCFLFALIHNKGVGLMFGPFAIAVTSVIIIARTKRFWPIYINHAFVNMAIILPVVSGL